MGGETTSAIGHLPAGWHLVSLGDLATHIGSGATPRGGSAVYLDQRIKYALVRSQNVFDRFFNEEGLAYISDPDAAALRGVELQENDVLLNITGDGITFGRWCLVPGRILPACVNQHVVRIRCDQRKCAPGYLLSFLTHPLAKGYIESFNAGGSRRALTKGHIESFQVPLPQLNEQQAIACILGALDDKIELNRRMNQTLEAMARAIFKSWFVDFDPVRAKAIGQEPAGLDPDIANLFPDSFEESESGEIPRGWTLRTVDEIAHINARTLGCRDSLDIIDYIEISEVMRGEVNMITRYQRGAEPSRARRRLQHGDSAVSTVRPDRGSYFLCLNPPETLIASTGFAVLTPKDGNWAFLHALSTRPEFGQDLGRLADGGAYPAIRPEAIGGRQAILPNRIQLITAFDRVAQPLLLRAEMNRNENRALAALRDTLLPRLISGELRLPDVERIVGRCI